VEQYETSLSGDLGVLEDISDNSYYVVKGANAAVLDGVTVTGGAGTLTGSYPACAGMVMEDDSYDSSVALNECKFVSNGGTALCVLDGEAVVSRSTISDNDGNGIELGVVAESSLYSVAILRNRGGVMALNESSIFMSSSLVADNEEAGITVANVMIPSHISGSTIAGNHGVAIQNLGSGPVEVSNTIIWARDGADPAMVLDDGERAYFRIRYSIVQGGHSGEGVLDAEPRFVSPETGDYSLSADSPAIDAGDPCRGFSEPPLVDLFGNPRWDIAGFGSDPQGLDMGAYEFQGTAGVDTLVSAFVCGP
jgi:hypothetical protein